MLRISRTRTSGTLVLVLELPKADLRSVTLGIIFERKIQYFSVSSYVIASLRASSPIMIAFTSA